MSVRTRSRLVAVSIVVALALLASLGLIGRHQAAAQVGGRPFGPIVPPTKIGGGGGGGSGTGDLTEVQVGSGMSVQNGTGPVPIVHVLPSYWQRNVTACAAGSAVNDVADDGTPTCIAVGDLTDVLAGTGITVTDSGGPQPTVAANLAGASCSAGTFVSALSAAGAGTCTTEVGDVSAVNAGTSISVTGSTGPTPTVTLNMPPTSCSAGSYMTALTATGAGTCTAGGTTTGTGTTGRLVKWASASGLTDSIATESAGAISVAGDLLASTTGVVYGSQLRWGSATDGTTGALQAAATTNFDFDGTDLAFRAIDNAFATALALTASTGATTINYGATLNNISGTTLIKGATTLNSTLDVAGNTSVAGSIFGEAVVRVDSAGQHEWSSTASGNGAPDLALARTAASQLAVTDGAGVADTDLADVTVRNALAFNTFKTVAGGDYTWSSTALLAGAADTGITRGVAGQVVINDGDGIATADLRDLLVRSATASNAGAAFKAISTGRFEFSSTTAVAGVTDVALGRNAAGVAEINSGAAATFRDLVGRTFFNGVAAGTAFKATSTGRVEWSSTTAHTGASDLGLERSAAGVLAVNDGAGVLTADLRDFTARTFLADNAGVVFKTVSGGQMQWSSTTATGGTSDVGIGRNTANRLEVNTGTAGTFADLQVRDIRANQDAVIARTLTTSGTPPTHACTATTVQGGVHQFNAVFGAGATITTCVFTFTTACTATPSCTVSNVGNTKTTFYIGAQSTSSVTISSQNGVDFTSMTAAVNCVCHH